MGIDSFKKPILFLSREEKAELIGYIKDTMSPEVLSGSDRYVYLVTMAEIVLKGKLTPARTGPNTMIRSFVAHRLAAEGYSTPKIGSMMGRNHSSVLHLIRRMDDILSLPGAYREMVAKYREFEALL